MKTGRPKSKNLFIGLIFNRWIILEELERTKENGRTCRWVLCKCKCGNIKKVRLKSLKSGKSKSCGCFQKESTKKKINCHGYSKNRLYHIFSMMKQRCYNPNNKRYNNYGARGIVVEWGSFKEFLKDMGSTYKYGLSIERKDVNGNYCKNNCIWTSVKEQNNNKQNTVYVKYHGEKVRLASLCKSKNINYSTIFYRLNTIGMNIEEAIDISSKRFKNKSDSESNNRTFDPSY